MSHRQEVFMECVRRFGSYSLIHHIFFNGATNKENDAFRRTAASLVKAGKLVEVSKDYFKAAV